MISVAIDVFIPFMIKTNVVYSDFQKQISGNKCSRSSFGSKLVESQSQAGIQGPPGRGPTGVGPWVPGPIDGADELTDSLEPSVKDRVDKIVDKLRKPSISRKTST